MTSQIHRTTRSAALMLACAAITAGCSKPASNEAAVSKERYNVTVRQLMSWNQLRQASSLRAGQRLVLYVDSGSRSGG